MLEKHALLPTFSMKIYRRPVSTLRLVKEANLLDVLLQSLTEADHFQVNRWAHIYKTTLWLVKNIQCIMRHTEVSAYVGQEQSIIRDWLSFVSFVQGMDPRTETEIHQTEEPDNFPAPFILCNYIGNVNPLLVEGAYAKSQETRRDGQLIDKAQRLPQTSLTCSTSAMTPSNVINASDRALPPDDDLTPDREGCPTISASATWLISNCLKTIETCLEPCSVPKEQFEAFRILSLADWPDMELSVSSQETSFHIPLHRIISVFLRTALRTCCGKNGVLEKKASQQSNFFQQILSGASSSGFSFYIMESPLKLRVLCAQVHASMRTDNAAISSCKWYRSAQWSGTGVEADLFLLQCCAALAPPDSLVKRIQKSFGLTNYTSLNPDHDKFSSEHHDYRNTWSLISH